MICTESCWPALATTVTSKLVYMCDGSGAAAWIYDLMGRPTIEERTLNGQTKNVGFIYYQNGRVARTYYPTGNRVYSAVNNANRDYDVVDDHAWYVFANPIYNPDGSLRQYDSLAASGDVLTENYFSSRGQLVATYALLQSSPPPYVRFNSHCYDYHLINGGTFGNSSANCVFSPGSGDNGNLYQATNNLDTNRTQNVTYDSLNRISQAYTSGPNWGEAFTIDAWGNMVSRSLIAGKSNYEMLNCAAANNFNQLTTCYTYDGAGNLIRNGSTTFTYDDENRMVSTAGYTYIYDGDGKRVEKTNGSTGTLYWTGPGAAALAESDLSGNINAEYMFFNGVRVARRDVPSNLVHNYLSDQIGAARQIVTPSSASSAAVEESDYYPYGGEIPISGSDPNHYKFTGKERDIESGNDYAGARYYRSSAGRFMTPDWSDRVTAVPYAVFGDPQSLNLYGYVRNDPVTRGDADGHATAARLPPFPFCELQGGPWCNADIFAQISRRWAQGHGSEPEHRLSAANWTIVDALSGGASTPPGGPKYKENVPTAFGDLGMVLDCTQACVGEELTVTSTNETLPNGKHGPDTPHGKGEAADLRVKKGEEGKVLRCAAKCGAKFGLDERAHPSGPGVLPHVHIQTVPGTAGGQGDLPEQED